MEAVRQDVDEEPADELARRERHGLVAAGPLDPVKASVREPEQVKPEVAVARTAVERLISACGEVGRVTPGNVAGALLRFDANGAVEVANAILARSKDNHEVGDRPAAEWSPEAINVGVAAARHYGFLPSRD